jgi:hypothetical protein
MGKILTAARPIPTPSSMPGIVPAGQHVARATATAVESLTRRGHSSYWDARPNRQTIATMQMPVLRPVVPDDRPSDLDRVADLQ